MIVAQFTSDDGKLVAFVWLNNKRFNASLYGRANLGSGPALAYCPHHHREQEPAERCAQRLIRRREAQSK